MPLKNDWQNGDLFTPAAANDMANAVNGATYLVSVTAYGAVGNGTDVTEELQAAINSGNALYVPPGTYLVSGLTLPSYTSIQGAGIGQTIFKHKANSSVACMRTAAIYNVEIMLDGFSIDGNKANQTNALIGLDINNTGSQAQHLAENTKFPTDGGHDPRHNVTNIKVFNTKGSGFRVQGRGVGVFSRLWSFGCDGHGFELDSYDQKFHMLDSGGAGLAGIYFGPNASNSQVTNIKSFYSGYVDRTTWGQGIYVASCKHLVMSGVQVQNAGTVPMYLSGCTYSTFSSISIDQPSWAGNGFSITNGPALVLKNAAGNVFSGVSIDDIGANDAAKSTTYGVVFSGSSTNNNHFIGTIVGQKSGYAHYNLEDSASLTLNSLFVNGKFWYGSNTKFYRPDIADLNGNTAIAIEAGNANAVNYVRVYNAGTGGAPALQPAGTDTDIGLSVLPKGTGEVGIYVTTGQTPTISAQGVDAAHDLNLKSKSTGVVKANGVQVADISSSQTLTSKTVNLTSNTLTGTTAQFNTALSDNNFATLDGTETFTNKSLTSPKIATVLDPNGNVAFRTGAGNASATNHLTIVNQISSSSPYITMENSSGTNVGLNLVPKGTGEFGIYVGAGGTPTITALGADAAHNLNLKSKGSGVVQANGVAVSTNSTTATHTAQQIELGHATDTTVSRTSAGQIAVEGNPVGIKVSVPASAVATGVVGQWAADSSWLYICTATDTWRRVAVATW